MVETDFRNEALKTCPVLSVGSGLAQIIVDDKDPLFGSAKGPSAFCQTVLQAGRLPVLQNLLGRGLPDVDHRKTLKVGSADLLGASRTKVQKRRRSGSSSPPSFGNVADPSSRRWSRRLRLTSTRLRFISGSFDHDGCELAPLTDGGELLLRTPLTFLSIGNASCLELLSYLNKPKQPFKPNDRAISVYGCIVVGRSLGRNA